MRKLAAYSLAIIFLLSLIFLPSVSQWSAVSAQSSAPEIRRLRPGIITAGTRTFTIRLEGRGFTSDANVLFDGVALPSARVFRKGRLLLAEVNSSLIASPATHTIQAMNSDGTTSAAQTLTVQAQDPDLTIRLDGNAAQEGQGVILLPTILTDSLSKGADILVWGRGTTVTPSNVGADIEISDNLTDNPAEIPITLEDKNGNISNTEIFFVVPRPVKISSVDPDTLVVGTDDVPLVVTGNFKADAIIVLNDMPLPTTVGKNDRLEATIPGSFRSQPTQLVVRVEEDGIQSQDQIIPVTPTTAPFIFTIAPIQIRVGERRPSINVIGANLQGDLKAFIDGQEAVVRSSSKRVLTVAIPIDLPLGSHTVRVSDASGNTTSSFSFEVVNDVTVSTVAGNGRGGFDPGCVSNASARFLRPRRLAFGPDGLLYVTDQQNNAIRTIDLNAMQTCTLAGTGDEGYNDSGNSLGVAPTFSFPNGIVVDASSTVYVTENGNNVVRRIRRSGAGVTVDTFAGTFSEVTDKSRQQRINSTREGLASYRDAGLLDSAFRTPDDIVIAPDGSIYIADAGNHAIRRITQRGGQSIVETIAGNGVPGFADGAAANARFNTPTALALSIDGNFLFVADTRNDRVRMIDLINARVSTVAGGGDPSSPDGQGGQAAFSQPIGLAVDRNGVIYVSELGTSDIRRIDLAGNVTTLAGGGGDKLRNGIGLLARFNMPRGLAIDRQRGVLYVADYEDLVIRAIALR
jgi:sugar lactone lactonase YvrE